MLFDEKTHKVKYWTMNLDEARAFITFLESEKLRHEEDIRDIEILVATVKHWFELDEKDNT